MTNDHNAKLRVDFSDTTLNPTTVYGIWNIFKVNSETDKYRSTFSGFIYYYYIISYN